MKAFLTADDTDRMDLPSVASGVDLYLPLNRLQTDYGPSLPFKGIEFHVIRAIRGQTI